MLLFIQTGLSVMLEIKLCCPVCSVHWQVYTLHYVACVMAQSHAHCLFGMHVTGTNTIVLVSCQDPCTLSWEKMFLARSCMWAGYKTTISELVGWSDHDFTTEPNRPTGRVRQCKTRLTPSTYACIKCASHSCLRKPVVKKACRQTLWLKSDKPVESMKG